MHIHRCTLVSFPDPQAKRREEIALLVCVFSLVYNSLIHLAVSVPYLHYEWTDLVYKLLQERNCCVICKRSQIPQTLHVQRISYLGVDILFTHCKWTHWTDQDRTGCMHVNIVVLYKVVVGHAG